MSGIQISGATIAQAVAKQGRVNRRPIHDFHLSTLPYAIQPFVIHPVLPGETMNNALIQARVVTDPIKGSLIGWHSEWYLFYVKLRDLPIRDQLTAMLLEPGADLPTYDGGGGPDDTEDEACGFTGFTPGINYMRRCLEVVTAEYFRNEGDNPGLIDDRGANGPGLPPATIQTRDFWHDSIKLESAIPVGDDGTLPGEDDYADANIPPEWANHYAQYQQMRALKLTEVTFEDWLRQFGVKAPKEVKEDLHRPELLRYVRDWTYPANTVDPETGIPNSVCSWSIGERVDKDRYFTEPGFIFGVNVTRPKLYLGRQYKQAVEMLDNAFGWLPALMDADPYTSLRRFGVTEGPLGHVDPAAQPDEAYWVDMRDLYLYGDQFSNFYIGNMPGSNFVARPKDNLERRYVSTAEAQAVFRDVGGRVRADGVIHLTIAGRQRDHT